MIVLRSLAFHLFFYTYMVTAALIASPLLFLPKSFMRKAIYFTSLYILFILKHIAHIRYEARGLAHVPEAPCIIASKHQSVWDVMTLSYFFPQADFIAKQELFWIPFFGWSLKKAGGISLNRDRGVASLRKLLRDCQKRFDERKHVLIFPEGTRKAPGAKPDYLSGVAGIYHHLNKPCLPVALNSGLFWPRRSFLLRPGTIQLHCLPLIPTGMDRKTFLKTLEERIETKMSDLI